MHHQCLASKQGIAHGLYSNQSHGQTEPRSQTHAADLVEIWEAKQYREASKRVFGIEGKTHINTTESKPNCSSDMDAKVLNNFGRFRRRW
jgi:hypothetical protein